MPSLKKNLFGFLLLLFVSGIAWFLGYVKMPYLQVHKLFWVGFAAGISLLFLGMLLLYRRDNSREIAATVEPQSQLKPPLSQLKSNRLLWTLCILSWIILACMVGLLISTRQKLNDARKESDALKIYAGQEEQRNKINLLRELIHSIDSLHQKTQDSARIQTLINRLVAISSIFGVRNEWDAERSRFASLSKERALLLFALIHSPLDTSSFKRILKRVSFAGADLKDADLSSLNLNGIDLRFANLENANLQNTRLDYADLRGANLKAAQMNKSSLYGAILISAQMNWTKIQEANLDWARLDSADLSNASLLGSSFVYSTAIHTDFQHAMLHGTNFRNGFFNGAMLGHANLTQAVLINASFSNTKLESVILKEAIIDEPGWKALTTGNQSGVPEILKNYQLLADSTSIKDSLLHRIRWVTQ